jgi:hypothetical protein
MLDGRWSILDARYSMLDARCSILDPPTRPNYRNDVKARRRKETEEKNCDLLRSCGLMNRGEKCTDLFRLSFSECLARRQLLRLPLSLFADAAAVSCR